MSKRSQKYRKQKRIHENQKLKKEIQIIRDEDIEWVEDFSNDTPIPQAPHSELNAITAPVNASTEQPCPLKIGDFVRIEHQPDTLHHTPKYLKHGSVLAQIAGLDERGRWYAKTPANHGKYGYFSRTCQPIFNTPLPITEACRVTQIPTIDLTPDGKTKRLRLFLRGQLNIHQLLNDAQPYYNFTISSPIQFTPEDLLAALRRFQYTHFQDILGNYILPIYNYFYKYIGLDNQHHDVYTSYLDTLELNQKNKVFIPRNAHMVMIACFDRLMHNSNPYRTDLNHALQDCVTLLESYLNNIGKPLYHCEVPLCLQRDFLQANLCHVLDGNPSKPLLKVFQIVADQQAELENVNALRIKAWSYYGGNKLYACDWAKSAKYLEQLSSTYSDIAADCALGYIYYYGRIDGTPNYTLALRYFTTASLGGNVEASYKLLDMMYNHYILPKNENVIYAKLKDLYNNALSEMILQNYHASFADIAWRYARCFKEGIGVCKDLNKAYYYYKQAFIALLARRSSKHFGDEGVLKRVRENIVELLEARFNENSQLYFDPWVDCWNIDTTPHKLIYLSRSKDLIELITPYCALPKDQEVYADEDSLPDDLHENITDEDAWENHCEDDLNWDDEDDLNWDDEDDWDNDCEDDVNWDDEDDWDNDCEDKEEDTDKSLLHLVSVEFWPNGKTYDYICNDATIVPGDKVIVNTSQGEKVVVVRCALEKFVKDLPLPRDRYKTIRGKL